MENPEGGAHGLVARTGRRTRARVGTPAPDGGAPKGPIFSAVAAPRQQKGPPSGGAIINKGREDAGAGENSLRVAGLGFVSLLVAILGLALVVVGLVLGVAQGHPLGAMVGLIVGMGAIAVAYIFND